MLRRFNVSHDSFLSSIESFLGVQVIKDMGKEKEPKSAKTLSGLTNEDCQADVEPCRRSTPDPRKRLREPTESPEESAARKPEEKWPKASKQPVECIKVPVNKDPCKKKTKLASKKPERPKRVHSELVQIKCTESVSNAAFLKNLKSRVNPEELGVKIGGIRETRTKNLVVEVKCAAEDRG